MIHDVVECCGAPRDMGLDQGSACSVLARAQIASLGMRMRRPIALPRRFAGGAALGAGAGREVLRHYPHQAERMAGIARATRLPVECLMNAFVGSALGEAPGAISSPSIALAAAGSAPLGALARPVAVGGGWIVRRSRPEVGFASVELSLPWLAAGIGGVNESGVAALFTPLEPDETAQTGRGGCAPPPILLVQECLQRFDDLDACLDWCMKRPVGGAGVVLLVDARGERAWVEIAGGERRVARADADALVVGGTPALREWLRKQLDAGVVAQPETLGRAVGADPAVDQLWIDASERRITWLGPGGELRGRAALD